MRCRLRYLVAVAVVLFLILQEGKCENSTEVQPLVEGNSSRGVPTYVGPIERLILLLMKPVKITENTIGRIGKGLRDILGHIPGVKELQSKAKVGKTLADVLNPFKDKIKAVYPGTLWCGDGDIASSTDDLGIFKKTDACCRAHDSCTGGIPAQEERHGLLNNGLFTRSDCACDNAFYNCLKDATNILATKIGTTYFNLLRPQCFKEEHPIIGCKSHSGRRLIIDKCEEYEFDTSAPPKYQWFDNRDFLHIIEV